MRGLGAWSAERVGEMFAIDKYMVLHASIFGLFLILLQKTSALFFIFPILAVFYFLRGLYAPTISTYINEKVDSSNRATMLSVNSQLLTIVSSASLLFAGYIADKYDLSTTFFAISISSIFFLILYVISLRKVEADWHDKNIKINLVHNPNICNRLFASSFRLFIPGNIFFQSAGN